MTDILYSIANESKDDSFSVWTDDIKIARDLAEYYEGKGYLSSINMHPVTCHDEVSTILGRQVVIMLKDDFNPVCTDKT